MVNESEDDGNDTRYDWHEDEHDCWNCGGEGYVYGCSWDWQCNTYDAGEGTCLCSRPCEVCNPVKPTPEQEAERAALRQVLADMLTTPQPKGHPDA